MPYFINPFHKHDVSEFPGVLVPLAGVPHRGNSVSSKPGAHDEANREKESTGSSEWSGGLTIDALRAEIDNDLAAGGVNTAYDRTF